MKKKTHHVSPVVNRCVRLKTAHWAVQTNMEQTNKQINYRRLMPLPFESKLLLTFDWFWKNTRSFRAMFFSFFICLSHYVINMNRFIENDNAYTPNKPKSLHTDIYIHAQVKTIWIIISANEQKSEWERVCMCETQENVYLM